jgi:toluene monooxygenase electron transfer component
MSNLANTDGLWQFIVRRTPAGQGSRVLFDELAEGPSCMMDGPYGHAYARTGVAREAVCVAGGSGLAPVLSICRALLAVPEGPGLRVYLGLRRQADLGVAADLQALALAHKRLKLTVVLSEPDPGAATARSGDQTWQGATGYVHEVVERELGAQAAQMEHYFAGPPPMINAMQDFLMLRAKVPPGQIHFDRFV